MRILDGRIVDRTVTMVNGIRRFIRRNVLVMCQFRLIFKGFPEVSRKWMQSKLCGLEVHSFVVHILL